MRKKNTEHKRGLRTKSEAEEKPPSLIINTVTAERAHAHTFALAKRQPVTHTGAGNKKKTKQLKEKAKKKKKLKECVGFSLRKSLVK